MPQTSKILLAVIITVVIVGGGVYYWQDQRINKLELKLTEKSETSVATTPVPSAPTTPKTKSVEEGWSVLYTDEKNGFRVVAKSECTSYFKAEGDDKGVSISLPRAKEWGGELTGYKLQTQSEFNEDVRETVSTELSIALQLKNGLLLTTYSAQDSPLEEDLLSGCWPRPELL